MKNQAIINVAEAENIVSLAKFLSENNWKISAAGKNFDLLAENNISAHLENCLTDKEYGQHFFSLLENILAEAANHETANTHSKHVKLVCINLGVSYKKTDNLSDAIKFLDDFDGKSIMLLEAAIKNYKNVITLCDPADYAETIIRIRTDSFSPNYRLYLAGKALAMISAYNSALSNSIYTQTAYSYPKYFTIPCKKISDIEHGANSHQTSALYKFSDDVGMASGLKQLQGKVPTYAAVSNVDAALSSVERFFKFLKDPYTVPSMTYDEYSFITHFTPAAGNVYTVITVHGDTVGAAFGKSAAESCQKTLAITKNSYSKERQSFGTAVFACSSVIDDATAKTLVEANVENVVAPDFTEDARYIFAIFPNISIFQHTHEFISRYSFISVDGGLLLQSNDETLFSNFKIATHNRPNQNEVDTIAFGTLVSMGIKTEAAVLVADMQTVAMHTGLLGRMKFDLPPENSGGKKHVLVCNSVLPFTDMVKETIISCNISTIIQAGGADSDNEFISFCDEKNIVMIFSSMTHIKL